MSRPTDTQLSLLAPFSCLFYFALYSILIYCFLSSFASSAPASSATLHLPLATFCADNSLNFYFSFYLMPRICFVFLFLCGSVIFSCFFLTFFFSICQFFVRGAPSSQLLWFPYKGYIPFGTGDISHEIFGFICALNYHRPFICPSVCLSI